MQTINKQPYTVHSYMRFASRQKKTKRDEPEHAVQHYSNIFSCRNLVYLLFKVSFRSKYFAFYVVKNWCVFICLPLFSASHRKNEANHIYQFFYLIANSTFIGNSFMLHTYFVHVNDATVCSRISENSNLIRIKCLTIVWCTDKSKRKIQFSENKKRCST